VLLVARKGLRRMLRGFFEALADCFLLGARVLGSCLTPHSSWALKDFKKS
jgi:hypothetical protein